MQQEQPAQVAQQQPPPSASPQQTLPPQDQLQHGEDPAGGPCRFFAAGNCRFGQSCRYSHNDSGTGHSPSCCERNVCNNIDPLSWSSGAPLLQDPAPPPASIACRFFAQGSCKFGNKCRFHHSQQVRQHSRILYWIFFHLNRRSTVIKTGSTRPLLLQVLLADSSRKEGHYTFILCLVEQRIHFIFRFRCRYGQDCRFSHDLQLGKN